MSWRIFAIPKLLLGVMEKSSPGVLAIKRNRQAQCQHPAAGDKA